MARWAIPCYAAILLTFLHLSARSDFVERWRLQEAYQETAGERLDQIESALRAFHGRNIAFFEFATGQYADILIENCRGFLRPRPHVANCSEASVKWRVTSPTKSTYTYDDYRSADRVTSGIRTVAPLLRQYTVAAESDLPKIANDFRTAWKSAFEADPPLSDTDPGPFAANLRAFARREDALRKVAVWALYDNPPRELMHLEVSQMSGPSWTSFDDIQPTRLKTGIQPFKAYLMHFIETHGTEPDFIAKVSGLRQDWLRSLAEGRQFDASAPTLPLAGIQANLQDLSRLLPLLLLSFYGLYCIVYLGWLRSGRGGSQAGDFPMFGFGFTGAHANQGAKGPWLGWIACISVPIGVLASFVGLVVWPLNEGRGLYFRDELCSVRLDLAWPSCSSTAWPAVLGLPIAALLTWAVVRAELDVRESEVTGRPLLSALPSIVAAFLVTYAATQHLRFASGDFAQWRQEHFIWTLNFWLPLAVLIAILAACRSRGGKFALAALLVLIWLLPDSPAALSRPPPEPDLGENCYGPACHVQ